MIVGYGIDIMKTSRIKRAIERFGTRFIIRIYTKGEIEFCKKRKSHPFQVYASFWAVKEAAMKALGTGHRRGVRFRDIEVCHHPSGKPYLRLYGKSEKICKNLGTKNIEVSMSHLDNLVIGAVIFEK